MSGPSWSGSGSRNAELRMDREFLKKAAAFFATENQNR